MFLVSFPQGCTTQIEPARKSSSENKVEENATEEVTEDLSEHNLDLKRRRKRFEHNLMNLVPRQEAEVTVTTTTTTPRVARLAHMKRERT